MPSRFLQAIGVDLRPDEEREARGRAVRTSRHSSRVGRLTSSRHRSTKLRTKERNKSSRSLMSATTGSESERRSRKKSSIRSNSGKKRSPRGREETEAERLARRKERKDEKRREREESAAGEIGNMENDAEAVPSAADEEPTSAGLGITTLCDIPQQQAVDVFQFQSDWSDEEDAVKESCLQPETIMEPAAVQYEDHPAEYEDATDGPETDHHQQDEQSDHERQPQEAHSDIESQAQEEAANSLSTATNDPVPPRSLAASVADKTEDIPTPMPRDFTFSSPHRTLSSSSSFRSATTQVSSPHDDAATERSTSPETSFKSPSSIHASSNPHAPDYSTPSQPPCQDEPGNEQTPSTAKQAAQTIAAEQRQKTIRRRSSHHSRRPELPRTYPSVSPSQYQQQQQQQQPYQNPWIPNQAYPYQAQAQVVAPIPPYNPASGQRGGMQMHMSNYGPEYGYDYGYPPPAAAPHPPGHAVSQRIPLDAAGNQPPLTGHAVLAAALSSPPSSVSNPVSAVSQPPLQLPPLYRRFTTLHHRLLLHLQAELLQLEDELAYLDSVDTSQRTHTHHSSVPGRVAIRPESRNEIEWRREEVLRIIEAKLKVYNDTLASFQKTGELPSATRDEVEQYQELMAENQSLGEGEVAWIGHEEDLVSLAPKRFNAHAHGEEDRHMRLRDRTQQRLTSSAHNEADTTWLGGEMHGPKHQIPSLAVLLSILIPLLIFPFIAGFKERMAVAAITGLGVLILLRQNRGMDTNGLALGRKEKWVVAGMWAAGMVVLAILV